MLSRTFRSETATREFLRKLFLRVTPDKQIFFPGTNQAETASTESYDGCWIPVASLTSGDWAPIESCEDGGQI